MCVCVCLLVKCRMHHLKKFLKAQKNSGSKDGKERKKKTPKAVVLAGHDSAFFEMQRTLKVKIISQTFFVS